jgi:hypothetical protein
LDLHDRPDGVDDPKVRDRLDPDGGLVAGDDIMFMATTCRLTLTKRSIPNGSNVTSPGPLGRIRIRPNR